MLVGVEPPWRRLDVDGVSLAVSDDGTHGPALVCNKDIYIAPKMSMTYLHISAGHCKTAVCMTDIIQKHIVVAFPFLISLFMYSSCIQWRIVNNHRVIDIATYTPPWH